jgi:hypothetical protein
MLAAGIVLWGITASRCEHWNAYEMPGGTWALGIRRTSPGWRLRQAASAGRLEMSNEWMRPRQASLAVRTRTRPDSA